MTIERKLNVSYLFITVCIISVKIGIARGFFENPDISTESKYLTKRLLWWILLGAGQITRL